MGSLLSSLLRATHTKVIYLLGLPFSVCSGVCCRIRSLAFFFVIPSSSNITHSKYFWSEQQI